ncbi:MAG: DNA cytosine methyltransferase, partial [Alphaproteobacteria bacterium]
MTITRAPTRTIADLSDDERRVPKLRVLDLFSGIGGFSLGLERTGGFETVAFCEIEEFPRRVLAKHWPEVPCYHDVRELTADRLAADGIAVDVICGGFPCQDISYAGLGAGLAGARSGLFYEVSRLIGELGPSYIILENVGALLSRGLDAVLGTLASVGYDAEWHCIPASALGAHHRRDRVWIIAYPKSDGQPWRAVGDKNGNPTEACEVRVRPEFTGDGAIDEQGALANTCILDEQRFVACISDAQKRPGQVERSAGPCRDGFGWWRAQPGMGRVADGIPDRAHRLKGLGNAVVPQIPELIGRAILATRPSPAPPL